jgi:hypothetical protein
MFEEGNYQEVEERRAALMFEVRGAPQTLGVCDDAEQVAIEFLAALESLDNRRWIQMVNRLREARERLKNWKDDPRRPSLAEDFAVDCEKLKIPPPPAHLSAFLDRICEDEEDRQRG